MASILLPFTSDIQQSAVNAGLSSFMADETTLDVYSTDPSALQSWASANQITAPITLHAMKTRMSLTPNASNVPYFTMSQLRAIYNYPVPSTSNYVVGVVSFGGGLYGSVDSHGVLTNGDVQAYWTSIGISTANQPKVIVVPYNGATNSPNINDGGSTMENTLDVQAVGGACPSANMTIILYIAPNTLDQFPNVLNYMYTTNITVNGVNYKPNLISCSWGAPEIYYGSALLSSMNSILSTMSSAGINVCVATGDNGSNDGVGGSGNYVDFPSSNPYVTAVGGTSLVCPNNIYDVSTRETAWSTGGGGVSTTYAKPSYQSAITASGRSTPDIASLADPNTGVVFIVNGQPQIIGGTSVAAPTIAGFLASINCKTFINPLLYQVPYSSSFHDVTSGTNGSYSATIRYDNCTGLGSINGANLASSITTLLTAVRVTGITLSSTSLSLAVAQTAQLTATVAPSNATNKTVSWSSSNSAVAAVVNGLVTAAGAGSVIITASSTDGSTVNATTSVTVSAAPIRITGLILNSTIVSLAPTQTSQLSVTFAPVNATNKTLSWSSSNSAVATVVNGLVTALSLGTATITASSTDGSNVSVVATVTVQPAIIPVTGITLNSSTATLHPTNTIALLAAIVPSNATNQTVTWSSNSSNATVNSSGLVTAVAVGTATIRASIGGVSANCVISITVPTSSVTVSPSSFSMSTGTTKTLTATVLPSNAANKAVTWSSANPSIASIASGIVTAGSQTGSTVLTVRTVDGGWTALSTVTVVIGVQRVSLNSSSIALLKGNTFQAVATIFPSNAANPAVTWSSAISSVVTVSATGLITAVGNGTGIITVVTQDGNKTASILVRVTTAVTSVRLNQTTLTLTPNASYSLIPTIVPSGASNPAVFWSSSNSMIVSVTSNGTVRGIMVGTATITARTVDGSFQSTCSITVRA